MDTKERRQQHKAVLKDSISAAARTIVQKEGWRALTIGKVAVAIGYTAPTIYEFYDDKNALLCEVMEIGFAEWLEELQLATKSRRSGEAFVKAIAQASWRFALGNPELYSLMHSLPEIPFGTEKAPKSARAIFQHIYSGLLHFGLTFPDPEVAVEMIWAVIHGWVSLTLTGRIKGGRKRAEGGYFGSIELLIENLFKNP